MRTLSTRARAALFAQETEEVFLVLLKIEHDDLAATLRFANNYTDIISNADTYLGCPFQITFPDEQSETLPRMKLVVDNVAQDIVEAVRSISSPARVTVLVVLAATPDTVELTFSGFTLRGVMYDEITVEGTLLLEDVMNEVYPEGTFTPATTPGLF